MTGSSAAALIGLMFVVITLVTGADRGRRSHEGTAAFSTPTVVHFGGALLVSAIVNAPWLSLLYAAIALGLAGLYGVIYVLRVAYRIKQIESYSADTEDWLCHTLLPFVAYGAILAGALTLPAFAAQALFAVAGAVVLLLFVGIHNAWDIVTFIAIDRPSQEPSSNENKESQ